MSTRKRKQEAEQEEELLALPSDESEEEEEYVFPQNTGHLSCKHPRSSTTSPIVIHPV